MALRVLAGDMDLPLQIALPRVFPFAEMSLSVDGLSGFFLLVVSLVTAAASIPSKTTVNPPTTEAPAKGVATGK